MKALNALRIGISLVVFSLLSFHCANPNLPFFIIINPSVDLYQSAVISSDSPPYDLAVGLSVPLPGCGATTFPLDPDTFTATLTRLLDGEVQSETDVTSAFTYSLNTESGAYTFTGNVELSDFGDYEVDFTVQNDAGIGARTLLIRLEQEVLAYLGGTYTIGLSSLKQQPADCLMPRWLLTIVYDFIKDQTFELTLPSGQAILGEDNRYPKVISLPQPFGDIPTYLGLDEENNGIGIDGPADYAIDLTKLRPPPGFDCVIRGSADGLFDDMDPNDLDGVLTIGIASVELSPSGQSCTLASPAGSCNLLVGLDADPLTAQ